ncbi:hypothetical protein CHS0354_016669 [Potamilus streckersoni]|uniref:Macro domain-containing protein n=1 Tax=Potamilus streckersoni TaxID=2493646 RepID=A0AAE0THH4_9BIVA|nr:hypothetical protein CHS0354_016669 [Potamilus streckersoni]
MDKTDLETEELFDRIPVLGKEDIEIACYTDGTILFPSKDTHIEESNLIQTLVTEDFTWSNFYQSALTENRIPFCIWRKVENEQGVHFQSTDTDESTYRQKMKQLVNESDLKVHKINYFSEGKHVLLSPCPSVIKANLVTIYRDAKGDDLYFIGLKQKVNIALKEYGLVYLENHSFPFEVSFEMSTRDCRALACFSDCLKTDQKSIIFQPFPQEGRLVFAASSVFEIETAIKKIDCFIASLVEKELDMSSYRRLLLQEKQTQMYVQEYLGRKNIACFLDCSSENVKITCTSKENLNEAEKCIKNCIAETKIGSEKRTDFEKLVDIYEGKMKISYDTEKDILIIVYTHDVSDAVLPIVSDTDTIYSLSAFEIGFLYKHCAEELQKLQNEYNVEINIQGDGLNLQSNSKMNIKNVEEAIRKLVPKCTKFICVDQEAHEFVSSEEGKTCITQLAYDNKAICTLQNAEDTEEDACDNVLCRWYCGTKGHQILLVQGRAADLHVDCLVIPVNDSIIPLTAVEHGIDESADDAVKHEVSDHSLDKGRHLEYSEWWIGKHRGTLKCGAKLYLPVENKKRFIEQNNLREQLINIFLKATELQYESIGLPLEVFDSQKRQSYEGSLLTAAVEATIMCLTKKGNCLPSVYLCMCEKQNIDTRIQKIEWIFQEMKDSKFMFYLKKAKQMMKGKKDDLKCSVHVGKLHEEKVDVLVNTVAKDLSLKNGNVSKAILRAAGQELQDELKKDHPDGIKSMEIAVTPSYQLKKNGCHCIYHLALEEHDSNILEKINILKVLTLMCLEKADQKGMSSIAFPALGTGKLEYPYRDVAWAMFEAVEEFKPTNQNLKEVKFILYKQDQMTIEAFELEQWRRKHLSKQKMKIRRVPDKIKGYLNSEKRLDFEISIRSDVFKTSKVVEVMFKIRNEISSGSRFKYYSAYALGPTKKLCNDAYEVEITDDKNAFGRGLEDCLVDALDKRISHLMFHLSDDMRNMAAHEQCKFIIDTIIKDQHQFLYHVDVCVPSQAELENIRVHLQTEESRAAKSWFQSISRTVTPKFFSKEIKWTFYQLQEKKPKQLMIQLLSDTQDHLKAAEQAIRKKLKAVQDSGDPLIINSVFGSGTVTVNPGVVRYLDASHDLDDQLQALEEKYGLKSHRNGCVLTLSGQADDLLSSANLLLHDIKDSVRIKMDIDQFNLIVARKLVNKTSSITFENDEMIIRGERGNASESQKVVLEFLQTLGSYNKEVLPLDKEHISKIRTFIQNLSDHEFCCYVEDEMKVRVVMWGIYEEIMKLKNRLLTVLGLREVTRRNRKNLQVMTEEEHALQDKTELTNDIHSSKHTLKSAQSYKTLRGLVVRVYLGDITKLKVDSIVNAANEDLANGAGVAYAIEQAAGFKFKEDCKNSVQTWGRLNVGEVRTCTAGDLKCKQILNAVGPRWSCYRNPTECLAVLKDTVKKCLEASNGIGYETIAIPSISAGIFGVPLKFCTQEYCQAVISFSKETPGNLMNLKEVHFVDISQEIVDAIQTTFSKFLEKLSVDSSSFLSQSSPTTDTFSLPASACQAKVGSISAIASFTSLNKTYTGQQQQLINQRHIAPGEDTKTPYQNTDTHLKMGYAESVSVKMKGKEELSLVNELPAVVAHTEMTSPQSTGPQAEKCVHQQYDTDDDTKKNRLSKNRLKPNVATQFEAQLSNLSLLKMVGMVPSLFTYPERTKFPFFTTLGGKLKIIVVFDDITLVSAQALVSTEDRHLSGKGTVAKVIREKAGDEFRDMLVALPQQKKLDLCDVMVTKAGKLPYNFVLHAISPHWNGEAVKDPEKFKRAVSTTVLNILKTSEENKIESVAIPFLGTSDNEQIRSTPAETCVEAMINGLLQFIKMMSLKSLTDIMLVSNNFGIVKAFFDILHDRCGTARTGKCGRTLSTTECFQILKVLFLWGSKV